MKEDNYSKVFDFLFQGLNTCLYNVRLEKDVPLSFGRSDWVRVDTKAAPGRDVSEGTTAGRVSVTGSPLDRLGCRDDTGGLQCEAIGCRGSSLSLTYFPLYRLTRELLSDTPPLPRRLSLFIGSYFWSFLSCSRSRPAPAVVLAETETSKVRARNVLRFVSSRSTRLPPSATPRSRPRS